jgi:hypothetical protein
MPGSRGADVVDVEFEVASVFIACLPFGLLLSENNGPW